MAELVKKATRESFGEAVTALAAENPDIVVLDADLAEATKTCIFEKKYPERFIDCGIAEGNMIGIAAGLAACGKIPFAASFAMFSAGRAYEQVRNSVGYPHLNVKIAGSHAGISTGEDGATHQCCEDIALMRTIPGMVVLNPADHYEMLAAVKAAAQHNGPVYLRLGRLAVESVHNNDDYQFELGKGITLRDGKDITIAATGLMVGEAVKAAKSLEAQGIDARVHRHPHHQALGRGPAGEGRPGDGPHRHRGRAQCHRRPGGGGVRLPEPALPHPGDQDRRPGCVRPLRPRPGPAPGVRPVRGEHRSHREEDPGQVKLKEKAWRAAGPFFAKGAFVWSGPSGRPGFPTAPPSPG